MTLTALKETPCIEVSDEDSEDGRLEVKKGRAPDHDRPNERRKRHKKHDNNESGSEKEEEDERPLKKARKESKKSNGASKKPGKKDRANDEVSLGSQH